MFSIYGFWRCINLLHTEEIQFQADLLTMSSLMHVAHKLNDQIIDLYEVDGNLEEIDKLYLEMKKILSQIDEIQNKY